MAEEDDDSQRAHRRVIALLGGALGEREEAYRELEALPRPRGSGAREPAVGVEDGWRCLSAEPTVALACAALPELSRVLCASEEAKLGAEEFRRAARLLSALVTLDHRCTGLFMQTDYTKVMLAQGTAMTGLLDRPPAELSDAEVLTIASLFGVVPATFSMGITYSFRAIDAEAEEMTSVGGYLSCPLLIATSHPRGPTTDEYNLTLLRRIMEMQLRPGLTNEDASALWGMAWLCLQNRIDTALTVLHETPLLEAVMATIGRASPAAWLSTTECNGWLFNGIFACVKDTAENAVQAGAQAADVVRQLDECGFLDACIKMMVEFQVGAHPRPDTNVMAYLWAVVFNLAMLDFSGAPEAEAKLRGAGPQIRYMIDHEIIQVKTIGLTSKSWGSALAANLFGRLEGGESQLALQQTDVDGLLVFMDMILLGEAWGAMFPLPLGHILLNLCVSDTNKELLLASPKFMPFLLGGFLLDDSQRPDTDVPVRSVVQRNHVEALQQMALFGPGKQALLQESAVLPALEAVVARGFSDEARECAHNAMFALSDTDGHTGPQQEQMQMHIMLSYNWLVQKSITRINDSLERRGYATW